MNAHVVGILVAALAGAVGTAADLEEHIELAASRHGLPAEFVSAVARVESDMNPNAVSHKGAVGLMQLMPATAERFGVEDRTDPRESLEGGCAYLAWLSERFEGNAVLVLAGYNAGEGAVLRHGGVPPFPETKKYIQKVLAAWRDGRVRETGKPAAASRRRPGNGRLAQFSSAGPVAVAQ